MQLKSIFITCGILASAALTGCTTTGPSAGAANYSMVTDAGYTIPPIPYEKIQPQYRRQVVSYPSAEKPGTLVVDTKQKFLYYTLEDGKAVRYGIGVGRDGFRWSGAAYIGQKREWPVWTPPRPMIKRQPQLAKYAGGMKPGLTNPLGARALYLYKNGRDSLYRLHGTPEWWTIGTNVSSGCIRLMNHDIMDLYNRAEVGSKVVVL